MATNPLDLSGNDLIINDLFVGATPGQAGTDVTVSALTNLGNSLTMVNAGSTRTLTSADAGKTILFDQLAGSVVTLPAATGSGRMFRFIVSVLATSNSHIVYTDGGNAGSGTGVFKGIIEGMRDSTNVPLAFASSTNDTITLNRTTTGSVTLGEWIEVRDIAANVWNVRGMLSSTGASFATPFSTT